MLIWFYNVVSVMKCVVFADSVLKEKLAKIMSSPYFTTLPEMKAPVEVAAAGNYGSFQAQEDVRYQQKVKT